MYVYIYIRRTNQSYNNSIKSLPFKRRARDMLADLDARRCQFKFRKQVKSWIINYASYTLLNRLLWSVHSVRRTMNTLPQILNAHKSWALCVILHLYLLLLWKHGLWIVSIQHLQRWTILAVAYIEGINVVVAANQWVNSFIAMDGWRYLWVAP